MRAVRKATMLDGNQWRDSGSLVKNIEVDVRLFYPLEIHRPN